MNAEKYVTGIIEPFRDLLERITKGLWFHRPWHGEETAKIAYWLAVSGNVNENLIPPIVIAAYLHDIGRGLDPQDHAKAGAQKAREILDTRYDGEVLELVCQAIAAHDVFSTETPEYLEGDARVVAEIVRDADLASFALPDSLFDLLYRNALIIRELASFDPQAYYLNVLRMYRELYRSTEDRPVEDEAFKNFRYLTPKAKEMCRDGIRRNLELWERYGEDFCEYVAGNLQYFMSLSNLRDIENFVRDYVTSTLT